MKLIDGKSVLLGMGIGIILTSLLGVIFFAGYSPQLTDAEIIRLSQKLEWWINMKPAGISNEIRTAAFFLLSMREKLY